MVPDERGSALLTDLYELAMLQAYFDGDMHGRATFEFFSRKLPPGRNFLLAAGLEQVLDWLEALHFEDSELEWLAGTGRFSAAFLCFSIAFLAGWRCGAGRACPGGHLQPVYHARYALCAVGGADGSVAFRQRVHHAAQSDDTAGYLDRDFAHDVLRTLPDPRRTRAVQKAPAAHCRFQRRDWIVPPQRGHLGLGTVYLGVALKMAHVAVGATHGKSPGWPRLRRRMRRPPPCCPSSAPQAPHRRPAAGSRRRSRCS